MRKEFSSEKVRMTNHAALLQHVATCFWTFYHNCSKGFLVGSKLMNSLKTSASLEFVAGSITLQNDTDY